MPTGAISATTLALATIGGAAEINGLRANLGAHALLPGTNIVAVEVHQAAANSSDLGFDLELTATLEPTLTITQTSTNYLLRWPAAAPGFRVQSTNVLDVSTNWPLLAATGRVNGAVYELPVALPPPRFFKLVAP